MEEDSWGEHEVLSLLPDDSGSAERSPQQPQAEAADRLLRLDSGLMRSLPPDLADELCEAACRPTSPKRAAASCAAPAPPAACAPAAPGGSPAVHGAVAPEQSDTELESTVARLLAELKAETEAAPSAALLIDRLLDGPSPPPRRAERSASRAAPRRPGSAGPPLRPGSRGREAAPPKGPARQLSVLARPPSPGRMASGPRPPSRGGLGSEGDESNAGAQAYRRQVAQLQRNDKRYAEQRWRAEREAMQECTFSPAIDPRSRRLASGGGAEGGDGAGDKYRRKVSHWQATRERCEAERRHKEEAAISECTFAPSIDPHSLELLAGGVRYPSRPASAAIATWAGVAVGAAGSDAGVGPSVAAGAGAGATAHAGTKDRLSDMPSSLVEIAAMRSCFDGSDGSQDGSTGGWEDLGELFLATQPSPPPRSARKEQQACDRLYGHALELQERRKELATQRKLFLSQPASPRIKALPAFYRSGSGPPPSVAQEPAEASAPPSAAGSRRPGSAPAAGRRQRAAAREADQQGRFPFQPQINRDEQYWRRFKLCDETFLERQQHLEAQRWTRLERQRGAPEPQGPALAPGTRRILLERERRQQGEGPEGGEGRAAALAHGLANMLLPDAWSPSVGAAVGGGSPARGTGGRRAAAAAEPDFPFAPCISPRAKALPAKAPEERHAEWGARLARRAEAARAADAAAAAACTFRPASATAGSRRWADVAPRVEPLTEPQTWAHKVASAASLAAHTAVMREQKELEACTFKPVLNKSRAFRPSTAPASPRAPPRRAASWGARPAAARAPAAAQHQAAAAGERGAAADVGSPQGQLNHKRSSGRRFLSQVGAALLDPHGAAGGAAALAAVLAATGAGSPALPLAAGADGAASYPATLGVVAAPETGAAGGSAGRSGIDFSSFLDRVQVELDSMQV